MSNVIERTVEALEAALANTVDTPMYPDGPCMDKDVRDDLRDALAELRRYEVVDGDATRLGAHIEVWPTSPHAARLVNVSARAILLVEKEQP